MSEEVVISIWEQIQSEADRTKKDFEDRSIIRRVPALLRRNEFHNQFYDPKIVSIGPYHHGKPELEMAERFKPRVAQLLFPNRDDVDSLYKQIHDMVDELRKCYEQEEDPAKKLTNEKFARMMFLDCCLVLALLEPSFPNAPFRESKMVICNFNLSFISMSYEAFYLLENQLPFRVLMLVTKKLLSINESEATKRFVKAVNRMPRLMLPITKTEDLLQSKKKEEEEPPINYLFELHYRKVFPNPLPIQSPSETEKRLDVGDVLFTYRSVSDLKSRGIHFRRSNTGSGDVTFKSYIFSGVLEISPFFISSNFGIIISNTIAYEHNPYGPPMRPQLISFVRFLQSLIDSPEDVKELRSKRIINTLGMSDEHVANLFQKMHVEKDDPEIYHTVRRRIDEHYKNPIKKSVAHLRTTYFNTPWAFIVFLAASTALAMAILQAYYNIHPKSK